MPIELIIEDGTGVALANSYVSVESARAYLNGRGLTLTITDDQLASLLIDGYEFLNTYECQFGGVRTFPYVQTGAWPRTGSSCANVDFPENAIPHPVQVAQIQIAVAANSGVKLFPIVTGPGVKRTKVGPLEREFDVENYDAGALPVLSNVELTLQPLMASCGKGCGPIWKTVRV